MTRAFAIAVAGLVVLSGLTGCSQSGETARPGQSAGPIADPLPPRPREIRVDGLDPCTLAPPKVLSDAGIPSQPHAVPPKAPGVRDCSWSRRYPQRPSGTLGVATATQQDVRNALSVNGSQVTTVAGFGAVEIPLDEAGAQFSCDVRVDVAPRQGLWVTYIVELGDEPGATHELMCQRAHAAAETIMRDLLARTK